jgi:DNA-binding FrmR family transcriptional regulator
MKNLKNLDTALRRLAGLIAASNTMLESARRVSTIITQARAEERDVSAGELDALAMHDDDAADVLENALENARAKAS